MKKVCICGSTKNYEKIKILAKTLESKGFYIFLFPDVGHLFNLDLPEETRYLMTAGLTYDHFQKIKKSDIVLFANFGGYMGVSATLELGVAVATSKHIVALNHDKEIVRECMFNDIVENEDTDLIVEFLETRLK